MELVPAMELVPGTYALIIGLRRNGGGDFCYTLQAEGRVQVIGETTGGGAHPVSGHWITSRFMIGVPDAKAVNPITKTNWEGTGVVPDVKVPAADALSTAEKLAEKKLASK